MTQRTFIILLMKMKISEKIHLYWRHCEYIAQSGYQEWRFDENGFPVKFCYYNQIDKQGGWFVKEDEEHNIHICSYDTVRTIL